MRTQDEILERVKELRPNDVFNFETDDLISFLDFEHAKEFMKKDATADEWNGIEEVPPRQKMLEYMEFAWEKANNERGLSAMRTMRHYRAWLWLDGDEEVWPTLDNYTSYGKPQLVKICEYLGLDASQWDDGKR